jgi:hypothetical protein
VDDHLNSVEIPSEAGIVILELSPHLFVKSLRMPYTEHYLRTKSERPGAEEIVTLESVSCAKNPYKY